jgi:beta-lactamase regulating signal transducer with metallopeptidase domain
MAHWFAQHLIVTTFLAIVMMAICKIIRPRPAIAHALWLIVLARLIVPPVFVWPISPVEIAGWAGRVFSPSATTGPASAEAANDGITVSKMLRLIGVGDGDGSSENNRADKLFYSARLPLEGALLGLWVLGSVCFAVIQGGRVARFRKLLKTVHPAPPELISDVDRLSVQFRMNSPTLAITPEIDSALSWSVRRPIVLLPDAFNQVPAPECANVVLAHELAHIKRKDHWTGWIELIAGIVWWWNPLFWIVRKQLHETAEMACDAWVIWALPERRREYAETLVRAAEMNVKRLVASPLMGMGAGPAVAFERRLLMILRKQTPHRTPLAALAAIILLAVAITPGWSQNSVSKTSAPATSDSISKGAEGYAPIEKALDVSCSLKFENIHLIHILQFIHDTYDVNLVFDWRVIPYMNEATSCTPGIAEEALKKRPYNPNFVTDGIVKNIDVKNVPLRKGLDVLLRPLNLTYVISSNAVLISSPAMLEADRKLKQPNISKASPKLRKTLSSPAGIEFENINVTEILKFISDAWEVKISLDKRAIRPDKNSKEAAGDESKYVTDGVVQYIDIRNIGLDDTLTLVLKPLNLTFKAENNIVYVSSHELIDSFNAK